ncbi:DUF2786 domain-containing protein [Actinomyces succiniciruminis]|uniref:DUF2786 domain-containing protein n=1 Tax=Actinomyces succiniciruminis TaxID=1522002 RepID=A0A1L7RQA7_9ACTO|nr:DUF2786 domain-containing protein [Actinomyces succiniciruminis]CED92440.1 Protein of unknown function (DUF2786) [Actinomyces succiniciruminis]
MSNIETQIRRLLAIAEDRAASPAERELAMQRATTLMARHSITSLPDDTDDGDSREEEITTAEIRIPGGTTTASRALSNAINRIARAANANTYYTDYRRRTGDPGIVLHVVAARADLEWLKPLASAYMVQAAAGWTNWRTNNPRRWKPMKDKTRRRVRDGYLTAYADGIADRIRTTRQQTLDEQTTAGNTGTALAVRDRAQRVSDYMDALDLRDGAELDLDERAQAAGRADGWNSGLGNPTQHNTLRGA